jgi:acid phosphatase (class A)
MKNYLSVRRFWAGMLFVGMLACAAVADSKFVQPADIDFKTLLTTAPSQDSDIEKQELVQILELQKTRTPEDVARAKSEEKMSVFAFSNVMGSWFNPDDLPVTAKLMKQVQTDLSADIGPAKDFYGRLRPPYVDSDVHPCVALETSKSYPSGHSTSGTVLARILAEIAPDKHDALIARGKQIGDDRVLGGMHFPSDVAAGRILGNAFADKLLANADFQAELAKAKAECVAHMPPPAK